jgi:uncharacterized membrane protein
MNDVYNGFVALGAELKDRFFTPIRHITFWAYLIFGMLGFALLGVWAELYYYSASPEDATHLRIALVTFFPALVGSVSLQVVFEEALKNKRMLVYALVSGIVFLGVAIELIRTKNMNNDVAIPMAAVACVLAILHWWIANGLNPAFQDELSRDAAVGGSPTKTPAGTVGDFRT